MPYEAADLLPPIVADVFELAGRFRAHGEAIARQVRQTQARWQVMSAASADPRTVAQIARRLGVTRQAVQRIADALVDENWAGFERNPDHERSPYLVLNKRGQAALAEIARAAEAYHAEIGAKLSATELKMLRRGLRHLIEATASIQMKED